MLTDKTNQLNAIKGHNGNTGDKSPSKYSKQQGPEFVSHKTHAVQAALQTDYLYKAAKVKKHEFIKEKYENCQIHEESSDEGEHQTGSKGDRQNGESDSQAESDGDDHDFYIPEPQAKGSGASPITDHAKESSTLQSQPAMKECGTDKGMKQTGSLAKRPIILFDSQSQDNDTQPLGPPQIYDSGGEDMEEKLSPASQSQSHSQSSLQDIDDSSEQSLHESILKALEITIKNKSEFITSKIPSAIRLKCVLRRVKSFFRTEFDLFLDNNMQHIVSAKKLKMSNCQIFKISTQIGKYEPSTYVGSIMTNAAHRNYWMLLPVDHSSTEFYLDTFMDYNKIGNQPGFGNLQVYADCTKPKKIAKVNKYYSVSDAEKTTKLLYRNSPDAASNNPQKSCQGTVHSTKNLRLIANGGGSTEYLSFRKSSENMFEMQIQHPLTPLQALAVVLTRFDVQLT